MSERADQFKSLSQLRTAINHAASVCAGEELVQKFLGEAMRAFRCALNELPMASTQELNQLREAAESLNDVDAPDDGEFEDDCEKVPVDVPEGAVIGPAHPNFARALVAATHVQLVTDDWSRMNGGRIPMNGLGLWAFSIHINSSYQQTFRSRSGVRYREAVQSLLAWAASELHRELLDATTILQFRLQP
jgi:hypothetical protein